MRSGGGGDAAPCSWGSSKGGGGNATSSDQLFLFGWQLFFSGISFLVLLILKQHRHKNVGGSEQQAGRAPCPLCCRLVLDCSLCELAPVCHSALVCCFRCDKFLIILLQKQHSLFLTSCCGRTVGSPPFFTFPVVEHLEGSRVIFLSTVTGVSSNFLCQMVCFTDVSDL